MLELSSLKYGLGNFIAKMENILIKLLLNLCHKIFNTVVNNKIFQILKISNNLKFDFLLFIP